tara:strand:- start:2229 stop:3044 length:816 start_codon:yes stop_codon:yes gene_type:complete
MGTIDYDPLDEEQAFTPVSLNAGFTEVADGINAIDTDAVKRYSLRSEHQPSLTPAAEHSGITWTKEMSGSISGVSYTLFATSNTPVIGPDGDLEVLFPAGIKLGMGETDRIGALLVLANVRVGRMTVDGVVATHNNLVVLTIQVKDSFSWVDVPRTRRSLSMPDYAHLAYTPDDGDREFRAAPDFESFVDYDIPLRTLVDVGDLLHGETIYGVRVVIRGTEAFTGMPATGGWMTKLQEGPSPDGPEFNAADYTVAQSNLSVIPFHALSVMS